MYVGDEFSKPTGVLSALKIAQDGSLSLLNTSDSGSEGPVHLVLSPARDFIYVANYAGGALSAVRLNKEDGTFAASRPEELIQFDGNGPNKERQEAPHAHGVFLDPTGSLLFCADLGTDRLAVWLTGSELTRLADIEVSPGSGPRHIAFGSTKVGQPQLVYLVHELANTVDVFELVYPAPAARNAALKPVQSVSFLPTIQKIVPGTYTGAEIAFTPSHSHLIISNRAPDDPMPKNGTDMLAIFPVQPDGKLGEVEFKEVGGRGARHFTVTKEFVAIACQKTNEVIIWGLGADGKLSEKEVARCGGLEGVTWVDFVDL